MSCETCRRRAAEEAPGPPPAEFYASLLDAMHSMAQPLTLLSSHFYLAGPATRGGQAAQQLQTDAEEGIEHLCTIFRLMQELIHVQSSPAHLAAVPFESILHSLVEDAEAVFAGTAHRFALQADTGSGLSAALNPDQPSDPPGGEQGTSSLPMVTIDDKRTRVALVSMLHMAREGARPGSPVTCSVSTDESWLTVRLGPEDAPENPVAFDEVTRLHLALARANMLGQRAVFRLASEPFSLCLELPVVEARPAGLAS